MSDDSVFTSTLILIGSLVLMGSFLAAICYNMNLNNQCKTIAIAHDIPYEEIKLLCK